MHTYKGKHRLYIVIKGFLQNRGKCSVVHIGICRSNPNNAMAQLAMGMLCVVYTVLVTPFSIEQEYVTPWSDVSITLKDNEINLPSLVIIPFTERYRARKLLRKHPLLFYIMLKQGKTWFSLVPEPRNLSIANDNN